MVNGDGVERFVIGWWHGRQEVGAGGRQARRRGIGEEIGDGGGAEDNDTLGAENDGAGSRRGERSEGTARQAGSTCMKHM